MTVTTFVDALAAIALICVLALSLAAVKDWRWQR